jgi:LPS export ABC transporter protein LptC
MNKTIKIIFFVITFLFISCSGSDDEAIPKQEIQEDYPDQISRDFTISFVDSNLTKTKLIAGRGRVYNSEQYTLLDSGVVVIFYSKESGDRISKLTADSAMIDDKTKNMFAYNNVVVVSDSTQTTLKTSFLQWKNDTEMIFSNEYVTIDSPQEYVTGVGFESDKKLENYIIYDVSGVQK